MFLQHDLEQKASAVATKSHVHLNVANVQAY
jgi:hypothetical protein